MLPRKHGTPVIPDQDAAAPFPVETGPEFTPDAAFFTVIIEPAVGRAPLSELDDRITAWYDAGAERGVAGGFLHYMSKSGYEQSERSTVARFWADLGSAGFEVLDSIWKVLDNWAADHGTRIAKVQLNVEPPDRFPSE
jgi:hypothetical protein